MNDYSKPNGKRNKLSKEMAAAIISQSGFHSRDDMQTADYPVALVASSYPPTQVDTNDKYVFNSIVDAYDSLGLVRVVGKDEKNQTVMYRVLQSQKPENTSDQEIVEKIKAGNFKDSVVIEQIIGGEDKLNHGATKFLLEAGVKNPVLEVAAKEMGIKWDKPKEGWAASV